MSATRLLVLGVVRGYGRAHGYRIGTDLISWGADGWANVKWGSIYHARSGTRPRPSWTGGPTLRTGSSCTACRRGRDLAAADPGGVRAAVRPSLSGDEPMTSAAPRWLKPMNKVLMGLQRLGLGMKVPA